jgi:hemin uptake protein HemP
VNTHLLDPSLLSSTTRVDVRPQGRLPVRTLKSEDILRGSKEVVIEHAGAIYRLKLTRQNKLILNK